MRKMINGLAAFTVLVASSLLLAASTSRPMPIQPESRLWFDGTSTLRDYTCHATRLVGSVTPADAATPLALPAIDKGVRGADLAVRADALECGNGQMNDHMRRALRSTEHPRIEYRMVAPSIQRVSGDEATVTLNGRLRIAGVEKPISTQAKVVQDAQGALRVRGAHHIVMSDFGVKAPTLMMGTLKVRDEVSVGFDILLRP